jgi:hypothetical protein
LSGTETADLRAIFFETITGRLPSAVDINQAI